MKQAKNQTQICEDVNECESGEAICDTNAECINTLVMIAVVALKYPYVSFFDKCWIQIFDTLGSYVTY